MAGRHTLRVLGLTRGGNCIRRVAGVSNRGGVFSVYGYGIGVYGTLHASLLFGAPCLSQDTCATGIAGRGYMTYNGYIRAYPTNTMGLNRGLYRGSNASFGCGRTPLPSGGV